MIVQQYNSRQLPMRAMPLFPVRFGQVDMSDPSGEAKYPGVVRVGVILAASLGLWFGILHMVFA